VPLHHVPIKPVAHAEAAFKVYYLTHFKRAEVRFLQRFVYGGYGVVGITNGYYGKTHSVVRHALVNLELVYKSTTHIEMQIGIFLSDIFYSPEGFYYS
jgi:hypothetical protein